MILALIAAGETVAVGAAGGFVARQVAVTAGRAAAVAGAVPWVVGGLTIYQLGKLGYKLIEGDDSK